MAKTHYEIRVKKVTSLDYYETKTVYYDEQKNEIPFKLYDPDAGHIKTDINTGKEFSRDSSEEIYFQAVNNLDLAGVIQVINREEAKNIL